MKEMTGKIPIEKRMTELERELEGLKLRRRVSSSRKKRVALVALALAATVVGVTARSAWSQQSVTCSAGGWPTGLHCFDPKTPAIAHHVNGNFKQIATWVEQKTGVLGENNLVASGNVSATGKIQENGNALIPAGAVLAFDLGSCPAGWTRFSALDSRFPRGAATPGATGGTDQYRVHVRSNQFECCSGDQGIAGVRLEWSGESTAEVTGISDTYAWTASGWETHNPPYRNTLFCRKD